MKKKFMDPVVMEKKGSKPLDVIFHGESGCHSMLQFAPNEGLMQNYSGMGLGGGTGAGMAPFVTNSRFKSCSSSASNASSSISRELGLPAAMFSGEVMVPQQ